MTINHKLHHIIITGPESTGKSTLALQLSDIFDLPLIEEYARTYLSLSSKTYTLQDLHHIEKKQSNFINEQYHQSVIHDTDILTLHIWAQEVFHSDEFYDTYLSQLTLPKIYLLLRPDIPWQYDELRENPEDRDRLFIKYENILKETDANYTIIDGLGNSRLNHAMTFLKKGNFV